MKKRPFDVVTENALNTLKKSNENFISNTKKFDDILVWIFGFSIAGTSLIVSHIANLNTYLEECTIGTILILLCVSIIAGIFYRLSILQFLRQYQYILHFLEGAFTKDEMMRLEAANVENLNIHQVYQKIKTDFEIDYSDIIQQYNLAQTTVAKENLLNYLKSEYINLAEWTKAEYDYSIDYIKGIYTKAFGLTDRQVNKIFKDKNHSFLLKIWGILSRLFFVASIGSFISVLIILVVNYQTY